MENDDKDKKEEIIGEVVSPDPKPQNDDRGGGETKSRKKQHQNPIIRVRKS